MEKTNNRSHLIQQLKEQAKWRSTQGTTIQKVIDKEMGQLKTHTKTKLDEMSDQDLLQRIEKFREVRKTIAGEKNYEQSLIGSKVDESDVRQMFTDQDDPEKLNKDIRKHEDVKVIASEVLTDIYQQFFKSSLAANQLKDVKTQLLSGEQAIQTDDQMARVIKVVGELHKSQDPNARYIGQQVTKKTFEKLEQIKHRQGIREQLKKDDLSIVPHKAMTKEQHQALHEKYPEAMKRLQKEAFEVMKERTLKNKEEALSIYGSRPMDQNNQSQNYQGQTDATKNILNQVTGESMTFNVDEAKVDIKSKNLQNIINKLKGSTDAKDIAILGKVQNILKTHAQNEKFQNELEDYKKRNGKYPQFMETLDQQHKREQAAKLAEERALEQEKPYALRFEMGGEQQNVTTYDQQDQPDAGYLYLHKLPKYGDIKNQLNEYAQNLATQKNLTPQQRGLLLATINDKNVIDLMDNVEFLAQGYQDQHLHEYGRREPQQKQNTEAQHNLLTQMDKKAIELETQKLQKEIRNNVLYFPLSQEEANKLNGTVEFKKDYKNVPYTQMSIQQVVEYVTKASNFVSQVSGAVTSNTKLKDYVKQTQVYTPVIVQKEPTQFTISAASAFKLRSC